MPPRPECVVVRLSDYRRQKAARASARRARDEIKHYIVQLPDGQVVVQTYPGDAARVRLLLEACNRLSAHLVTLLPDD